MTHLTDQEEAELESRMQDMHDELERLTSHEKLTRSQERRCAELLEEQEMVAGRILAATRRRQLDRVREAAKAGFIEAGSDSSTDPKPARRSGRTGPGAEFRGRALDLIEQTENSSDLAREQLDAAAGWVQEDTSPGDLMSRWVLTAGNEDYRSAFAKLVRNPTMGQYEWDDKERAAFARAQELQRAMSVGTDSAGGYLVPFTLDPAIILTNAGTSNRALRSAFTVKTIATDTWNGVTSAGVTAEWTAEAAEVADASPTLAQPTITPVRGDAFVPFSFEAQGDTRDLESELSKLLYDAKERLEAAAFINGTGSGQPRGLLTAAIAAGGSTIVAATTNDTLQVADVYKLKKALPARYRPDAGWLANEDVYDMVRQFASGSGPQSAFWADFGDDTPSRLLGKPTWESSELSGTITAATNNYLAIYGDLKQYYVVDRVGATIELVPHLFGANRRPTGQRGLLLWFRTGGDLVNPAAVRVLNA